MAVTRKRNKRASGRTTYGGRPYSALSPAPEQRARIKSRHRRPLQSAQILRRPGLPRQSPTLVEPAEQIAISDLVVALRPFLRALRRFFRRLRARRRLGDHVDDDEVGKRTRGRITHLARVA